MASRRPRTALITGASSGIGYELARLFARDGYNLVLVARNAARLDEIADEFRSRYGVEVKVLAKDLAHPGVPQEIFDALQATGCEFEALVNNAGFGTYGPFAKANPQEELEMLQVNIVALTQLTQLFLPAMIARRRGKILNVASTAAFLPGPLMAIYYATKAYVLSFSEALTNELAGSGVTVTAFCPGATRTGFQERAAMQESRLAQGIFMDAPTVARIGYRGLIRHQSVVIPGAHNKLLALVIRLLPRQWVTRLVRYMQESPGD